MVAARAIRLCRKRKAKAAKEREVRSKASPEAANNDKGAAVEAANAAAAVANAAARLQTPADHGLNSALEQTLLRLTDDDRPENTKKAYQGKIKEWLEYCDKVWSKDSICLANNKQKLKQQHRHGQRQRDQRPQPRGQQR